MQSFKITTLVILAFATTAFAQPKPLGDSAIWFKAKDAPTLSSLGGSNSTEPRFIILSPKSNGSTLFERKIGRWKDPTTMPHSRAECVDWATGKIPFDGEWKTCAGWKNQFQWMYSNAYIRVATALQEDISDKVDNCLGTAAVAGAAASLITGGSSAVPTFEGALKGCLVIELKTLITASAWIDPIWGDYE